MKIKAMQFITTPVVTLLGIALTLPLILLCAIGLLLASLKELIKYFIRLLTTNYENQGFRNKERTIPIIQIIKNQ
jgi:hypothetical protein